MDLENKESLSTLIRRVCQADSLDVAESELLDILTTLKETANIDGEGRNLEIVQSDKGKEKSAAEDDCRSVPHKYFSWFLENILNALSTENLPKLSKKVVSRIDQLTVDGLADLCLVALVRNISRGKDSTQTNHCVTLLERLIENRLEEVVWMNLNGDDIFTDEIIVVLASVPDRMANRLKRENSDIFSSDTYVKTLNVAFLAVVWRIRQDIAQEKSRDVKFLGRLLGKLCAVGFGDIVWKTILNQIATLLQTDFILSRIFETVIGHVPVNNREAVLIPILHHAPSYGVVGRLFGDCILRDRRVKFLLTNKLILHKHYSHVGILKNIIGYLRNFEDIFKETLDSIICVWSDGSYIHHASYEQQVYITSAILICLSFLKEKPRKDLNDLVSTKTMHGMMFYLDSGIERLQTLGMIVAEFVAEICGPSFKREKNKDSADKLKFEYKETDMTRNLKLLVEASPEFIEVVAAPDDVNVAAPDDVNSTVKIEKENTPVLVEEVAEMNLNENLDSDDDLEPYDLSNDKKKDTVPKPKYLRQCMEGFLVKEDPDTFEVSLRAAENLILSNLAQACEIAEEFTKIILHADDQYETENFDLLCKNILVALLKASPKKVAEKLCEEFYARNYSIKQRLDCLSALAAGASEISQIKPSGDVMTSQLAQQYIEPDDASPNWQEVVRRRVDAKTRRFAHPTREVKTTENTFGAVAGYFFFPLVYPSAKDPTIDIQGENSILLVRLLYTLGVVLHSAINTPIVSKMADALFDFIWLLRSHQEVAVRRGILFSVSMVYLSVPSYILLGELQCKVLEMKEWTELVLNEDSDDLCRHMARQTMSLLAEVMRTKTINE